MQKKGFLTAAAVIVFMFALIAAYVFISYGRIKPEDGVICEGVKVGQIEIGGMSGEEAQQAVNAYKEGRLNRVVEVDVSGQTVSATVGELGYAFSAGDFLEKAMSVGKSGTMIENYKQIKEASQGKISYPIEATFDDNALKKFVKKKCRKLCTEAKNATVKMKDGNFVYTKSREGVSLDVDETCQQIKQAIDEAQGEDVIRVTANVKVEQPKVSYEAAAKCKDKIGTFSTNFSAGNVNRSKNLANAARLINGSVIYPGETFSVHDTISPLTEENGYYEAASYNNGKVEDSLGGGVCQVSTTLYNAVLRAELEIAERSPHSMVVSYVQPSMDAAIAGDYKDFKFKNNTDVPVYIQGGTYGGTISFTIYGEETRSSDRKIRFESEVTDTIEPGADKVTYDKTKPESYMTVTQQAHTGYKAKLWKIVTENGKETKTQINSSTYSASPRYVTKGSMKAPQKTPKPAATKKPRETKKPSTRTPQRGSTSGRTGSSGSSGTGENSGNTAGNTTGNTGGDASQAGQGSQTGQDAGAAQDPGAAQNPGSGQDAGTTP